MQRRATVEERIQIGTGTIGQQEGIQTVNARELHKYLAVGTALKDWIARRIEEYGFLDGQDFCSFLSESGGGRRPKEYHLTLDMAKQLSMVERTEKGKKLAPRKHRGSFLPKANKTGIARA